MVSAEADVGQAGGMVWWMNASSTWSDGPAGHRPAPSPTGTRIEAARQ